MTEIYSIGSVLLFASPVILGVGVFCTLWFRDEFWKDKFYDYND